MNPIVSGKNTKYHGDFLLEKLNQHIDEIGGDDLLVYAIPTSSQENSIDIGVFFNSMEIVKELDSQIISLSFGSSENYSEYEELLTLDKTVYASQSNIVDDEIFPASLDGVYSVSNLWEKNNSSKIDFIMEADTSSEATIFLAYERSLCI